MKNKKLNIWIALGVIFLFVYLAVFGCGGGIKGIRDMRFGIDIRGGVEAVFEPAGTKEKPTKAELEMAREVIETRLDAQNILDREVTVDEKAGNIIVRFPWKSDEKDFDPETAIQELGQMAELTFRGPDGTVYVKGSDVAGRRWMSRSETSWNWSLPARARKNLPMPRRNWQGRIWESTWMRR